MKSVKRLTMLLMSAFLIFLAVIPEAVIAAYTEDKSANATSDCDTETAGQGTHGYKYFNNETKKYPGSTVCCSVTGLDPFQKTAVYKKNGTKTQAICCVKRGTKIFSGSVIPCCNNGDTRRISGSDYCAVRSGSARVVADPDHKCKDPKKPYHFTYSILMGVLKKNISGDGCCDVAQVNMIKLDQHCCSTSNSPCFPPSYKLHSNTPPCCGSTASVTTCKGVQRLYSNAPDAGPERSEFITACRDPLAGLWNVTENLAENRINIGYPVVNGSNAQCCGAYAKDEFKKTKYLQGACCKEFYDRFRSNAVIKQKCCVFPVTKESPGSTGAECHNGVRCCSDQSTCRDAGELGSGCIVREGTNDRFANEVQPDTCG
jgi:hypothetical protein